MKNYLNLIRVKHWIKNFLIFFPMIFSKSINIENFVISTLGFFAFSLASSYIYIINDLNDIEKDKLHPRKKLRPLPSGMIKCKTAKILSYFLLIISLLINLTIENKLFTTSICLLITYILINLVYSIKLKNVAIIDVLLLASGFVLRVYYGAALLNISVSDWLFLTVLSASLFLGLGKRKKELIANNEVRQVLKEYNEAFLDKFQHIFVTLTLTFYSLWVIEQKTKYMIITIPIIIIIFMKYSLIVETQEEGDPTTILFSDKILVGLCILFSVLIVTLFLI